jgi:hypothetical protein
LNAAENDEKLELSKIVPSKFGDADTKITATLELAEVVRKTASLGATYPQIVNILENAKRQRNLAGELVVDAVPVSNRVYLEAVLGKDTAKRDDSVKRASGESSRSGRRWLWGIFGRNTDDAPTKKSASEKSSNDASTGGADSSKNDDLGSPSAKNNDADAKGAAKAKQGDAGAGDSSAKKDDAVQKAKADDDAPTRPRLFDFFRRGDE